MNFKLSDRMQGATKRLWRVLDRTATVAVVVAAVAFLWNGTSIRSPSAPPTATSIPIPTTPMAIEGAPTMGTSSAQVVLVEFSDFRCSYCQRFAAETLPSLKTDYIDTGLVRFVYRHNPLNAAQTDLAGPAEAAECAGRQDKFWVMHDRLFENSEASDESYLFRIANEIGIDVETFAACVAGEGRDRVRRDAELAASLQVRGTPVFFVGTVNGDGEVQVSDVILGARPIQDFRGAIEKLLGT